MQSQAYGYQCEKASHGFPTKLTEPACNLLQRSLRAVTAQANSRYSRDFIVRPSTFSIRAGGNFAATGSIDPWVEWIHPEGMPYYYHPGFRVVTDSYIRDGETLKNLQFHLEDLWDLMKRRAFVLPETCDIFLQVQGGSQACNYYVVDHESHSLLWLDEVNSEEIGLPWATCEAHQRHTLAEEYWAHVEYFPHHIPDVAKAASDITDILTFGRGDQLTSDSSTFPYDAKQCAEFLDMIRNSRQSGQEFTWLIARIWTVISRHRFDTYHGQEYARINRDQRRLGPRTIRRLFGLRALELALFRAPQPLEQELELLHVDDLVYTIHWRKFIGARMSDWKQASFYASGIAIAHLILLQLTEDSLNQSMALAGALFGVASLITSTGLLQKYTGAEQLHATDAVERVRALDHPKLGFQLAAAVFSLPRAFQMWSLLILPIHIIFLGVASASHTSLIFAASVIFILGCILLATAVATTFGRRHEDTDARWWWGRFLPGYRTLFGRQPDASSPV